MVQSKKKLAPQVFDVEVEKLLCVPDGKQAVDTYIHQDPMDDFAIVFNQVMKSIPARYIKYAFHYPQVVLARRINLGLIPSLQCLQEESKAIMVMTAMSLRNKNYRHETRPNPASDGPRRILIVAPSSPSLLAHPMFAPNEEMADWTEFMILVRAMGRLPFQAYRRFCDFERRHKTQHGAYTDIARMAVLDHQGRIVRFRKLPSEEQPVPIAKTVRQVHSLVNEACEIIDLWKS
jgi:hypothetical protein